MSYRTDEEIERIEKAKKQIVEFNPSGVLYGWRMRRRKKGTCDRCGKVVFQAYVEDYNILVPIRVVKQFLKGTKKMKVCIDCFRIFLGLISSKEMKKSEIRNEIKNLSHKKEMIETEN